MEEKKITRRAFFRGAATIAGAAAAASIIPIRVAHAQKADKKSMQYQDTPKNGQDCAISRSRPRSGKAASA